jgi:hypothetical protein
MRVLVLLLISLFCPKLWAQFDPAGGEPGSNSIHRNDPQIIGWATKCSIERGWQQINDTTIGIAEVGEPDDAIGPANNLVVSLGDGGEALLEFDPPIINNNGYDFAIFENGFQVGLSFFLELAFVEVSADGINFIRFENESLTDTSVQIGNFDFIEPTKIKNLAGKHQAPYGTLFDLSEVGLDTVRFVKIIDVIGSIDPDWGTRDTKGRIINDPFPTPFPSSGFDLDAVAMVRQDFVGITSEEEKIKVYPTLARIGQKIIIDSKQLTSWELYNLEGKLIDAGDKSSLYAPHTGIYLLQCNLNGRIFTKKLCVK